MHGARHHMTTPTRLLDLPGMRPRQLDAALTLRLSTEERARLDRAAADLGVPVARLVRVLLGHVLSDAGPAAGAGRDTA